MSRAGNSKFFQGCPPPLPLVSFEYHNSPAEIESARAVLKRFEALGTYHCNLKEPGSADFALERFLPIAEFTEKFPGGLTASLEKGYGDIFCALDPSSIRDARS